MSTLIAVIAAAASMACQDWLGTLLVVCESSGRALMAGILDASGDWAKQVCTIFGAGVIIRNGWTLGGILVLCAMSATSFLTTTAATLFGHRNSEPPLSNEELRSVRRILTANRVST